MKRKTLLLDQKSIKEIVSMKDAIGVVEEAFAEYGKGRFQMPAKIYLHLDRYKGDFRAMPAYLEKLGRCSLKWVNVHPENARFGLPAVMAIIILSDPRNGFPVCVMDGTYATSLRTGAAGGVAAKYLARRDSKVVGMVGCGAQARAQLEALKALFDIREVRVWGHETPFVKGFIADMKKTGLNPAPADGVEDCVRGCDIIVTTTPSRRPLVKAAWLKRGVHINAIGADAKGKEELEPAILKKAKLVVDSWEQASHSGEINVPLNKGLLSRGDVYAEIGEVVSGKKRGRTNARETTVFDSTGLAIQDAAIADLIYKSAIKRGKGRFFSFF